MKHKIFGLTATAVVGSSLFTTAALADSIKVESGDTLWSLSKEHNTTVSLLKSTNSLSSDFLRIGQVLELPGASNSKAANVVTSTPTQSTTVITSKKDVKYVVKSGDSLWVIAKAHNTSVSELKKVNKLNSDLIRVGQTLIVKQESVTTTKPATTTNEKDSSTTTTTSNTAQTTSSYKVQAGDSLWKIANKFNVTIAELKVENNLKSDVIKVGQVIKMPGQITGNTSESKTNVQTNTSSKVETMISEAKKLIGTPYVWAGNTPSGFDCSGYIYYVLNKVTSVSRLSTAGYWDIMKSVSTPSVGDFVFFTTYKAGPSHMGIYLGNNEFIHASSSGVTISSLQSSYWKERYLGARQYVK
ncbi:C40 family peptidase [Bacillus weihaiensis]|uniref:C40 family peptidase n=1 Tax=Bacillus weihaiensis TaxID=1547283 RepID=UPI00235781C7|nr:peptidoglycan endopeptidase [Bacillus weihaiensis]